MMIIPYFLSFSLPVVVGLGIALGGWWVALTPLYLFGIVPIFDILGGLDTENPEERKGVNRDFLRDLPLWLWAPTQLGITAWGAYMVSQGTYSGWEIFGLTISVGLVGAGGGINVAHELMHRRGKFERALAEIMLTTLTYAHFTIEHVLGHHRRVATPEDAASSRYGESLYAFWPRSLIGSAVSAWELEGLRVKRRGAGLLHLSDRRFRQPLVTVAMYVLVFSLFGWIGVIFWAGQSAVAILMLETINYIEHYGLQRKEIAPGRYERVQPQHSWNASQRVTNWLLFNLQRHSDHHYLASRPYWQLRHYEDVPQMPYGYATMLLTAFVPSLWKRLMHPRVEAWHARAELDEQELRAPS